MNYCKHVSAYGCYLDKANAGTIMQLASRSCSGSCFVDDTDDSEMNDGGSADYYKLPKGATDLQDIIEHKEMCYSVGNIFKAAYRLNDTTHSEPMRDLRKIVWFANRELNRLEEKQQ